MKQENSSGSYVVLLIKYVLRSLVFAVGAGLIVSAFNLPGKILPGDRFSDGRLVYGLIFSAVILVLQLVLFPLIVYQRRSQYPNEKMTLALVEAEQLKLIQYISHLSKKYGLHIVGVVFGLFIILAIYDSIR